jgi:hypothetical protein
MMCIYTHHEALSKPCLSKSVNGFGPEIRFRTTSDAFESFTIVREDDLVADPVAATRII